MRVIVCGARDCRDWAFVWRELDRLHAELTITAVMQGGASGVDTMARDWAAARAVVCHECCADWAQFGMRAGPIRNARMLEWRPDTVIAFPGGRGTADMVRRAEAAGVEVIRVEMAGPSG
jgi:hypothetical protein